MTRFLLLVCCKLHWSLFCYQGELWTLILVLPHYTNFKNIWKHGKSACSIQLQWLFQPTILRWHCWFRWWFKSHRASGSWTILAEDLVLGRLGALQMILFSHTCKRSHNCVNVLNFSSFRTWRRWYSLCHIVAKMILSPTTIKRTIVCIVVHLVIAI